MSRYLLRRFAQMAGVFFVFLTLLFTLLHAMPGDITNNLIGNPNIPASAREQLRQELGLDLPLWQQYLRYITNFFRGNLGMSFSRAPNSVASILADAIPRTVFLIASATILAYWLGFKTGKIVAWRRGSRSEHVLVTAGVFFQTVFYPWFAIVMLWLFGLILGWFPLGRFITASVWHDTTFAPRELFAWLLVTAAASALLYAAAAVVVRRVARRARTRIRVQRLTGAGLLLALVVGWWVSPARRYVADIVHHTVLPVITLAIVSYAAVMLLTRSSMLETMKEDYILTARAKGLDEKTIRDRHAARNALLPVTTSMVLSLATVVGGAIVTETIFSWPGVGLLILDGINANDIPLVMGGLAVIGVMALIGHLVADLLYAVLDPRIRLA
ncbi:MAG TPA: ABC transporter permease [Acidimicrobiia bacterium]|nr:ABC transporter permease [Acidimicrobiia bacterium]